MTFVVTLQKGRFVANCKRLVAHGIVHTVNINNIEIFQNENIVEPYFLFNIDIKIKTLFCVPAY